MVMGMRRRQRKQRWHMKKMKTSCTLYVVNPTCRERSPHLVPLAFGTAQKKKETRHSLSLSMGEWVSEWERENECVREWASQSVGQLMSGHPHLLALRPLCDGWGWFGHVSVRSVSTKQHFWLHSAFPLSSAFKKNRKSVFFWFDM